jgi:hypothetical protein
VNNNQEKESITLTDRFGVGFLSAVCFLITYWICFILLLIPTQGFVLLFFSLKIIGFSTLFFFVLGFVTLDNYFIKIITPAWRYIDEVFRR